MGSDGSGTRLPVAMLGVLAVMLGAMLAGGATAQVAFSYAVVAFFGLYVLLGVSSTARNWGEWRPYLLLVGGLVVVLGAAFAALWYFHFANPTYTDPVLWLGFPRATAVVVYGLWLPPALLMMFAYPYLFDDHVWQAEQVTEFEQMDRREATAPASAGGDD